MKITSEQLAYWYLRLNGFLIIQNFIVHPDSGSDQHTDADVLGVRFPYRAELEADPMVDDVPFSKVADKPFIILAEVKKSDCNLNGPWKDRQKKNLQRVLRAIGALPKCDIETAAEAIYTSGTFSNSAYHLSLACFGEAMNSNISEDYPNVPQVLWDNVLAFIYKRFRAYPDQKASHGQWNDSGKNLWDGVWNTTDQSAFRASVTISG
jgi:hypothetical protein